jgi:aldehyde dehydrogenase (NAD+)
MHASNAQGGTPPPPQRSPTPHAADGSALAYTAALESRDVPVLHEAVTAFVRGKPHASADVLNDAVAAAREATSAWSALPAVERSKLLYVAAQRVADAAREIAVATAVETGATIHEARAEVAHAAAHLSFHAGWADKLEVAFHGRPTRARGVVAALVSPRLPIATLAWVLAPALATGNAVLVKPATASPRGALALAKALSAAGLPPGLVAVLPGGDDISAAFVANAGVAHVTVAGREATCGAIAAELERHRKPYLALAGGKGAHLVFADADLEQAADGIVRDACSRVGQAQFAGVRVLAEERVLAELRGRVVRRMQALRVGDPLDKNSDVGPCPFAGERARYAELVDEAIASGAERSGYDGAVPEGGTYVVPTLLADVAAEARIAREELYAPVATLGSFRTLDEGLEKVTGALSRTALTAWTSNVATAARVTAASRAGVVRIHAAAALVSQAPFGGFRASGDARPGQSGLLSAFVERSA